MDIKRLLEEYHVHYISQGNKHCTEGWINVHCPFCEGSTDYHLGIHEDGTGTNCWRCGPHSITETVAVLLGISMKDAIKIMKGYGSVISRKRKEVKVSINPIKYPSPNNKMTLQYKKYLNNRGFNAGELERIWGLKQTGPMSLLDGIDYSYRILIPIYWDGEMVSFQGRDITGLSDLKYLACPKKREKIHHKDILYKHKDLQGRDKIIVVEGVPDVWRLGYAAVATFGIAFKIQQVLELSRLANEFFIIFDEDRQAQRQAKELSIKLKTLGKKTEIIKIKGDPGDMEQKEADYLVKQLLGKEA